MQDFYTPNDTECNLEFPSDVNYDYIHDFTKPIDTTFDIAKFIDNNVEFSLNVFQVMVFSFVILFMTCCIPNNRYGAKISKLETRLAELLENMEELQEMVNEYETEKKENEEEKKELVAKNQQFENENAFLVSRLKKLEEKNSILVNSLEEFISKKYVNHPYNLRKKERVDYTPQLNNTSTNTSTMGEGEVDDNDSDYQE